MKRNTERAFAVVHIVNKKETDKVKAQPPGLKEIKDAPWNTDQRVMRRGMAVPSPEQPSYDLASKDGAVDYFSLELKYTSAFSPYRKRAKGGGAKPSLSDDQIEEGQKYCKDRLDNDPAWFKRLGWQGTALDCIANVKVLKHLDTKSWQTVKRHIVAPVIEKRPRSK
jgi:hypothetical protein